jgi:signal transduction histidine kinase
MKIRRRLIVYYLIATLLSTFLVGLAVLEGIERLSMDTIEQQLVGQSRLAEIYISQIAFLENPDADELDAITAGRIITNLSLILGNVRIYDKSLNLLASSQANITNNLTNKENVTVLNNALKGNYAYLVRGNSVYFASPVYVQGETFGLLQIIYPLSFLTTLMNGVTGILTVGAVGFALLMTILSIYIAGRVTKPIKQLVTAANNYANRNFAPVNIKSSDEIAQLCRSFNRMGAQLNEYIQRQRLFVANVSHELKTPLTAIKGYSEYLTDEVKGNPDLQKAVYHLNNESERLAKLVDEVLTLSKIDSGREDFEMEKLDFSSLVKETVNKMSLRSEKYGVRVEMEVNPGIYIIGDKERLIQVLVNLIDNAIKYSPPQTQVWVRLYRNASGAILSVIDCGMGIPKEQIPQIYERFYRADNAKGVPGTGLGLSIVKNIVDVHNGSIEIESEINKGTTVTLKLPSE